MATTNPYDTSGSLGFGQSPSNPYLASQAGAIANTATRNLQNNILPGIQSGAVAAGGYGGSRQGIAEGNAIGQTNQDITNATSNLYGNAYAQDQNYNLGLGTLYNQSRNLDQQGAQIGANLTNSANTGYVAQGAGVTGVGNTQQQAPWTVTNNAGNAFSQFAGLGGSQINTQNGSTLGGIVGGALGGAQLINNLGLGNSGQTTSPYNSTSQIDPNTGMPYYANLGGG